MEFVVLRFMHKGRPEIIGFFVSVSDRSYLETSSDHYIMELNYPLP